MDNTKQKTDAWFQARKGKWTASNLEPLMVKGKDPSTLGAGAISLCYEKLAERLSTETREIKTQFTDWGIDHEAEAIQFFEDNTDYVVKEAPFVPCIDDELKDISGGSPDGFALLYPPTPYDVEDMYPCSERDALYGIIEVKCPHDPSVHLKTLISKEVENKRYMLQMQWNMYCTNTDKCLFISYDPRMEKDEHKMVVIEVKRDDEMIAQIKERILIGENYLKQLEEQI